MTSQLDPVSAPADAAATAAELVDEARRHQYATRQTLDTDDVPAIRSEVRKLARVAGLRIRTGIVDNVLAVILADAHLWTESTTDMKRKLGAG